MKTPPLAVGVLICLALAGCRTDPSITLLERQNRMLEDEVYRLRGVLQDYQEGMMQNCIVAEGIEGEPVHGETWKSRESAAPGSESSAPRGRKSSGKSLPGPVVEMPGEAQPPGEIPDTLKRPAGTRAPVEPGKLNSPQRLRNLTIRRDRTCPAHKAAAEQGRAELPASILQAIMHSWPTPIAATWPNWCSTAC